MTPGGLETLAEYGRALDTKPPRRTVSDIAFCIYNQRRVNGMPGTAESDWFRAERALYANMWVDSVISNASGNSPSHKSIEEQVTTLAHAIKVKRSGECGPDSYENWELAARMQGQRSYEGKIIVNRALLFL